MSPISISTVADIQSCVKDNTRIHVTGNRSKPALSNDAPDVTNLSVSGMRGITEYQPEEYTVTAYAGTPVQAIQDELKQHGQYLPFDPLLSRTATIGGTVATNLSGSRRFRYGGIRDFILGMHVVDGLGRAFRCGGKVVKNSAGFDLAKFFVGSLGEYAILTELTFKVFPEAPVFNTVKLHFDTLDDLLSALFYLNQSVFELDALDIEPDKDGWLMLIRISGNEATLSARITRLVSTLKEHSYLKNTSDPTDDGSVWDKINDLSWADNTACIVKVVITPRQIPAFDRAIESSIRNRRYAVGGNVAWIATDDRAGLAKILEAHQLTGLTIRGAIVSPIIGKPIDNVLADRVKHILDPQNKFV